MTDADPRDPGLARLVQARDARWRRAGLAGGGAMVLIIGCATLSPAPLAAAQTPGFDKLAHFLGFALLIFPVIVTDSRRWAWAVPLAILYGGAIELVQPAVGRAAEWLDWGADISGVLAGAALAELLHDRLRARVMGDLAADALPPDSAPLNEVRRAELIEDLRVVLREELAAIQRPGDPPIPAPGRQADAVRRGDLRH